MVRKTAILLLAAAIAAGTGALAAETLNSGLRGSTPLNDEGPAPPMTPMRNSAEKEVRNYPEQPPVIPHSIEGYQLTLNTNRCLTCHKPEFTEASGAPMISVTHFMDRDGQVLSDVTPRRYFCTTCHVQQTDARPLVPNLFQDANDVGRKR